MSVIAFGSAKSSPGVTTTVLALAARWPSSREPLVVEADPSGGDLVSRLTSLDGETGGLRDTPSTVQLAASSRSGLSDRVLLEHLQRLPGPGEVRVLVAPPSPFAASTAMAALAAARFGELLRGLSGMDVLLDVGRVDAASPSVPLLRELGAAVLVARPTLGSVLHTRELVASLRSFGVHSSLLVIGDRPYSPAEVVEAIGAVALVGVLPDDPVGARVRSAVTPRTRSCSPVPAWCEQPVRWPRGSRRRQVRCRWLPHRFRLHLRSRSHTHRRTRRWSRTGSLHRCRWRHEHHRSRGTGRLSSLHGHAPCSTT